MLTIAKSHIYWIQPNFPIIIAMSKCLFMFCGSKVAVSILAACMATGFFSKDYVDKMNHEVMD